MPRNTAAGDKTVSLSIAQVKLTLEKKKKPKQNERIQVGKAHKILIMTINEKRTSPLNIKTECHKSGALVHTCNPALWEAETERSAVPVQPWAFIRPCMEKKITDTYIYTVCEKRGAGDVTQGKVLGFNS